MREYKCAVLAAVFITACSSAGRVDTVQSDSLQPLVAAPAQFDPAAADLVAEEQQLLKFDSRFYDNDAVMNSKEWKELQDWSEGCDQAKSQLREAKEATAAGNGKR